MAARVGLCQLLLAEGRYADLLEALTRLTGPQAVGAEAYRLLLKVRGELVVKGSTLPGLSAIASAATAVCLSTYESEEYYLAMADLYLVVNEPELGMGYLQTQATAREHAVEATTGLARLLRKLKRPQEALVWLGGSGATTATPAARLERAYCLLARNLPQDAVVVAEQVLMAGPSGAAAEAHAIDRVTVRVGSSRCRGGQVVVGTGACGPSRDRTGSSGSTVDNRHHCALQPSALADAWGGCPRSVAPGCRHRFEGIRGPSLNLPALSPIGQGAI